MTFGTVSGPGGTIDLRGGTVAFTGSVAAQTLDFKSGTAVIDQPQQFFGAITNFAAGDTIDLASGTATSYSYKNGVLNLSYVAVGTTTATPVMLDVATRYASPQFDTNGGTEITVGASSPPTPPAITAPPPVTVQEGGATTITGVGITDAAAANLGEMVTITLADTSGLLSANTAATGGGGAISGSGTTDLTITGLLSQVNADLTTLTDQDSSAANDSITINASDSGGGTASQQTIAITPALNYGAIVQQDYSLELLRSADAGGLASWTSALVAGSVTPSQAAFDLASSAEATTDVLPIVCLYEGFFDRAPDPGGFNFWVNQLRSGDLTLNQIAVDFAAAPEFAQRYGAEVTPTEFVTALYADVLGRAPDPAGLAFWVGQLATLNPTTEAAVALDFTQSPEYLGDSTLPIDNWLAAAGESGSYSSTISGLPNSATATAQLVQAMASFAPTGASLNPASAAASAAELVPQTVIAPPQHALS